MSKRGRATHRIAFVVGQTLGNAVYSNNLRQVVDDDEEVAASWYYLDYPRWAGVRTPGSPSAKREPPTRELARAGAVAKSLARRAIGGHRQYEVWAAWASMNAMRMLARDLASHRHDAIFFHTGATALLSARLLRDRAVISLDGTPHVPNGGASLTPWSDWTKSPLELDYGVKPSLINVIPPGVDLAVWRPRAPSREHRPVKLLFVGRDVVQKGADVLLQAFTEHLEPGTYELDMVTKATLTPQPGLRIHHELPANGEALKSLYASADIFVFPTRRDAFGIAVIEAMASGLPVVASNLNALPEIVRDGTSGLLVPVNDASALATAIKQLGQDPERRRQMGLEGRRVAEQRFGLVANADRVIDVLKQVADETRRPQSVTTVSV